MTETNITPTRGVVVVPTVREQSIQDFLRAWEEDLRNVTLIVVEDNPECTFDLAGAHVEHYSHADIEKELGREAWIIPRKTDCVRSYGYYKAWQKQAEWIVTLDDDCYPPDAPGSFLAAHARRLNEKGRSAAWVSTIDGLTPRGVPYYATERELPCVVNHGLWEVVPDLDAPTQLQQSRHPREFTWSDRTIPVGSYFPMCGMNLAVRREVLPAFYFLLMGRGYDYDRFGDIWSGLILKKIVDYLGYCVNTGSPAVKHVRASNIWSNLKKEAATLEANESLWRRIDAIRLRGSDFRECYREVALELAGPGAYWEQVSRAMQTWVELFHE